MNDIILPKLELRRESGGEAKYYSYSFEHGWAIFTVNDATGEFHITSDWGNWSFRWNIDHLGCPTLTEFIARGDCHYLANKLGYGRGINGTRELDIEGTMKSLRGELEERADEFESGVSDSADETGRALRALIESELDDFQGTMEDNGPDVAYFTAGSEMMEFFCEMYEHFTYKSTAEYIILQNALLPFFVEQLRSKV